LPFARFHRFVRQYEINESAAHLLVEEGAVADFFEQVVAAAETVPAKVVANWVTGELFAQMKLTGVGIESLPFTAQAFAELVALVARGEVNQNTGKDVLAEMFASGISATEIVQTKGLRQVSDAEMIARIVAEAIAENPQEVASYKAGKLTVANWLFGQVMKKAGGKANPQVVRQELEKQLQA
jgi:aspartyl-tRNA(Asn)/glutamyl-tRNA(Gln) amidotransferase subunit B